MQSADGTRLLGDEDILDGQTAWQSVGGMQLGSIWGHGAYQAPDWTADWLHRELTAWLDLAAQDGFQRPYAEVDEDHQALLRQLLKREYRGNQVADGVLVLSERRLAAMQQTAAYYDALFGSDPALQGSRKSFAMKEGTLPDAARREPLTRFFWTAWVAATERPGHAATYTNNWPHEPLIGNQPTAENLMWSIVSVILLIAGIGFLVWAWAFLRDHEEDEPAAPPHDPLSLVALTPSQKALGKYLFLVVALFGFQVMVGGVTAHYTVEGQDFYGIPLSRWFPYSLMRTWHIQSALFWIATGFLALGFTLLVLRYIRPHLQFNESLMNTAFWWLNGGLVLMIATSLLPIAIMQFHASASQGLWYARSEAFMQQDLLQTLRWVRAFGDVVFIVGALAMAWQVIYGVLFGAREPATLAEMQR